MFLRGSHGLHLRGGAAAAHARSTPTAPQAQRQQHVIWGNTIASSLRQWTQQVPLSTTFRHPIFHVCLKGPHLVVFFHPTAFRTISRSDPEENLTTEAMELGPYVPGVSHGEFRRRWRDSHSKVFLSVARKISSVRYVLQVGGPSNFWFRWVSYSKCRLTKTNMGSWKITFL